MARTPFLKQVTLPTGNTYTISDYRGSLGAAADNPTETSLPAASELNAGNFYNVITAGTYGGVAAEVGDWIICAETSSTTYSWILFTGTIDVDQTYDPTSTNAISGAGVADALSTLPEPMVFKGTVGAAADNPTITALPVDGSATVGDTYKVITDGTYAGTAAEVGDTFICDSKTSSTNTWSHIPSGDEPSGTVTNVAAGVGLTTADGNPITSSGTIKAALQSETASALTAASKGSTANREYAVGVDAAGDLSVNIPWSDTTYTAASAKLVKTSVPNVTAVGSMPTFTVSNEVLTITAGAVPTLGTAIDVATGSLANDGTGDTVVISVSAN